MKGKSLNVVLDLGDIRDRLDGVSVCLVGMNGAPLQQVFILGLLGAGILYESSLVFLFALAVASQTSLFRWPRTFRMLSSMLPWTHLSCCSQPQGKIPSRF